jgi:hypothetical protein
MNWQRALRSSEYQLSEDGRYSVCRVGNSLGERFEAWRYKAHKAWREYGRNLVANGFLTSQAARDAAEGDANGTA